MSKIEKFTTEQQLTTRLEELRDINLNSGDIKVISQHPLTNNYENFNNITTINAEGSAWDKIVAFFSSGDPTDRAFKHLNLSPGDKDEYRQALENDEILLYIDKNSSLDEEEAEKSDYDYDSTSTNTRFDHQDKYVSEENMTDFTGNLREENKNLNRE